MALPTVLSRSIQLLVEKPRGANEAEMGKSLREIAQQFSAQADLLGKKAHMVGVSQCFLEIEPRLFHTPAAGQTFHIPKRAHRESAFPSSQPIVRRSPQDMVAINEGIFDELFVNHSKRGSPSRIVRSDEFDQGHQ